MALHEHSLLAGSPLIQAILNQPPPGSRPRIWGNHEVPSSLNTNGPSYLDIHTTNVNLQYAREEERRRRASEPWLRAQEEMRLEREKEDAAKNLCTMWTGHAKAKRGEAITCEERYLLAKINFERAKEDYEKEEKEITLKIRSAEGVARHRRTAVEAEKERKRRKEMEKRARVQMILRQRAHDDALARRRQEEEDGEERRQEGSSNEAEEAFTAIHRRELARAQAPPQIEQPNMFWQILEIIEYTIAIAFFMAYHPCHHFFSHSFPLIVQGVRQFFRCPDRFRYCPCGPFKRTLRFLALNPVLAPGLIALLLMVYRWEVLELTLELSWWFSKMIVVMGLGWLIADAVARKMR